MTLSDPKPGGWANGELLTSAQMNSIRNELLKAIDGADGGPYSLSADLVFSGAGEVQFNSAARVLTGASLEVDSGSNLNVAGELHVESAGSIEVDSGGAVDVNSGGELTILSGGAGHVETGGTFDLEGSAIMSLPTNGLIDLLGTSALTLQNTATINLTDTAILNLVDTNTLIRVPRPESLEVTALTSTNYRIHLSFLDTVGGSGTSAWVYGTNGEDSLLQIDVTTGVRVILFPLRLRSGDIIERVSMFVEGGFGVDHVALPASLPQIQLVEIDLDGLVTTIGTQVDTSANVAAYNLNHEVALTGLSETVASPSLYYIRITGESGANSEVDKLAIRAVNARAMITTYRSDYETI